jgi:integrase
MSWIYQRKDSPNWYLGDRHSDGTPFSKSLKTTDKKTAEDKQKKHDFNKSREYLGLPNDKKTYSEYKNVDHAGYANIKFVAKTKRSYYDTLRNFERIVPLPDLLMAITPSMAQHWQNVRRTETATRRKHFMSPTSVNIELRNLHAFFEHAKDLKYIIENPFEKVGRLKVNKKLKSKKNQFLTSEQIQAVLSIVAHNQQLNILAHLYIYAGLRLQEATHLRWQDIDFNSNMIKVQSWGDWTLKDYEDRELPMAPKLLKVLQDAPKKSELICPGKKGVRNKDAVSQAFNRIYKRAGLPFSGVHILRHTFITQTVNSGAASASVVKEWVGHSSIKTTEGYIHKDQSRDQDFIKAVNF